MFHPSFIINRILATKETKSETQKGMQNNRRQVYLQRSNIYARLRLRVAT